MVVKSSWAVCFKRDNNITVQDQLVSVVLLKCHIVANVYYDKKNQIKKIYTLQGNVEAWLGQLLGGVKKTIHNIIKQAWLAISDPGFKLYEFQSMFPAQIGLLGIQMVWTRDSEEALGIAKNDKKVGNHFCVI